MRFSDVGVKFVPRSRAQCVLVDSLTRIGRSENDAFPVTDFHREYERYGKVVEVTEADLSSIRKQLGLIREALTP